jgi:hypothetical protein
MATRHLPQRAEVLAATVTGGEADGCQRVWAAAVRSPKDGSHTVLVINDAMRPWSVRLKVDGPARDFQRLTCTTGPLPEEIPAYAPTEAVGGKIELVLSPFSLTILTDTPLPAEGPGRW